MSEHEGTERRAARSEGSARVERRSNSRKGRAKRRGGTRHEGKRDRYTRTASELSWGCSGAAVAATTATRGARRRWSYAARDDDDQGEEVGQVGGAVVVEVEVEVDRREADGAIVTCRKYPEHAQEGCAGRVEPIEKRGAAS